MEVLTDGYKVIESGVVHVFESGETKLVMGDMALKIIFDDTPEIPPGITFTALDSKNGEIKLTNARGPLGYGTTRPFQIGNIGEKGLYLTFIIRSLGDKFIRTFEYTLYSK